jgi:hypothetical protein
MSQTKSGPAAAPRKDSTVRTNLKRLEEKG